MKLAHKKSYAPLFLFLGALPAILAVSRTPAALWVLDSLTAVFALAAALVAGARLALGSPDRNICRLWQLAFALLVLVAIGEFGGPWVERMEREASIGDVGDALVLIATLVILWLAIRLDRIPVWSRRVLWAGFLLHIFAVSLVLSADAGN